MTDNPGFVDQIVADWRKAPLDARERVMLEFTETITTDATKVTPAMHDRLRAHGFDDVGITQVAAIASWFNYINRMADALGVGRPAAP